MKLVEIKNSFKYLENMLEEMKPQIDSKVTFELAQWYNIKCAIAGLREVIWDEA